MIKFLISLSILILFTATIGKAQKPELWGMTSQGGVDDRGVIFKVNAEGTGYWKSHDFTIHNPGINEQPTKLTQYSDGKLYGMTSDGGQNGCGVLYSYDPVSEKYQKEFDLAFYFCHGAESLVLDNNGWLYGMAAGCIFSYFPPLHQFNIVHSFSGDDGSQPAGSLLKASDGKLYGMTVYGGEYYNGVIFSYESATNTFELKVSFEMEIFGGNPRGSLCEGKDGHLLGMTKWGGLYNYGTLFDYDPSQDTIIVLHHFAGNLYDGSMPEGSLCIDSVGNLYGMTTSGGLFSDGVIFSYQPVSGNYSVIHMLDGSVEGSNPRGSLCLANNDWLYGMAADEGTGGYGTVFRINKNDFALEVLHSFSKMDSLGKDPYGSFIVANDGLLYGITTNTDIANGGVLFSLDPVTLQFDSELWFNLYGGAFPHNGLTIGKDEFLYGATTNADDFGYNYFPGRILFRINPANGEFEVLKGEYDPDFYDGNIYSSLTLGSDGWFYGTTTWGEIFRYHYDLDSITVLISNSYYSIEGSDFRSSLVELSDGWFYGTGTHGGLYEDGVIYRFNPVNNEYQKLFDFDGETNGNEPTGNMVLASDGLLYGLCKNLGPTSGINGIIYSFDPVTFTYTKRFEFVNEEDGKSPYGGLIQASDQFMYGVTPKGGAFDEGVLFRFDISSDQFTKLEDFNGEASGGEPYGSLFQASNEGIYGMTVCGGLNNKGLVYGYDPVTGDFEILENFTVSEKGALPYGNLIEVHQAATIVDQTHDTTICVGSDFLMEVIGGGGFLTHTWFHDGAVAGGNSKSLQFYPITYADSGYYWCVIENDLGSVISDSIHLLVADTFDITITVPEDSLCLDEPPIVLQGNPSNGFFQGAGMMIDLFYPDFAGVGSHDIEYVTTGCVKRDTTTIAVFHTLDIPIVVWSNKDTLCLTDDPIYIIHLPAGGILSGTGISGDYFDPVVAGIGVHTVTYTFGDWCKDSVSIEITVELCTGVDEPAIADFEVFPNPFSEYALLKVDEKIIQGGITLLITDLYGRIVSEQKISEATTMIERKYLPPGTYLLQLINDNGFRTGFRKLLVQ